MTNQAIEYVRLSRFVIFVKYKNHVEIQHTARNKDYHVSYEVYDLLTNYYCFRKYDQNIVIWVECGVLVSPYIDTSTFHELRMDSEAALANQYHQWYWKHEIESEREYKWFGKVVVKMPSDLFFYQELLTSSPRPKILELGFGYGGGLHYLSSIMSMLNGGVVVGIDNKKMIQENDMTKWPNVDLSLIQADALKLTAVEKASRIVKNYDLIIADLGGDIENNISALKIWSSLIPVNGVFIIEDLWFDDNEVEVIKLIDDFLLNNKNFGIFESASRYPFLKGMALKKLS